MKKEWKANSKLRILIRTYRLTLNKKQKGHFRSNYCQINIWALFYFVATKKLQSSFKFVLSKNVLLRGYKVKYLNFTATRHVLKSRRILIYWGVEFGRHFRIFLAEILMPEMSKNWHEFHAFVINFKVWFNLTSGILACIWPCSLINITYQYHIVTASNSSVSIMYTILCGHWQ